MLGWNNLLPIGQSAGENLWKSLEECLPGHSEVIAHYARTRELPAYIEPSTPRGSRPRCSLHLAFSSPGSLHLASFVSRFLFPVFCFAFFVLPRLVGTRFPSSDALPLRPTKFGSPHTCVFSFPHGSNRRIMPERIVTPLGKGIPQGVQGLGMLSGAQSFRTLLNSSCSGRSHQNQISTEDTITIEQQHIPSETKC